MEIQELSLEDMEDSGGGGRSWDHEAIIQTLQDAYEERAEEDGETVVIGMKLEDIADEFYDGTAEDLRNKKHPGPNVSRTIAGDLPEAGFNPQSKADRKSPVGVKTLESGSKLFKIELTPQE